VYSGPPAEPITRSAWPLRSRSIGSQLAAVALRQARHVAFGLLDLGQHLVRQQQEAHAGGGKRDRHRLALEQGRAVALLHQFDLVRQRRLRQVQQLGGAHQTAGGAQGSERT
jgi:hypothetical protein